MFYFHVFTKRFWTDIFVGQRNADENQDPELREARQQEADIPGRNVDRRGTNLHEFGAAELEEITWQGKDGAIARAFESIKVFIVDWEWDKVDRRTLLQDCAFPVLRHLAVAFAIPMTGVALYALLIDPAGWQFEANWIFRILATASMVVDTLNSSKRALNRWFQVAHKVARDDRYLVGEILLNYSPSRE
jgi:E3 ubiquitin-protein ligase MARCH6